MEFQVSACWLKRVYLYPKQNGPRKVSCVADTCAALPESGQLSVRQAPLWPQDTFILFANRAGFTKMVLRACVGETGGNSSSTTMSTSISTSPSPLAATMPKSFTVIFFRVCRDWVVSSHASKKPDSPFSTGCESYNRGKSFYNHVYKRMFLQEYCLAEFLSEAIAVAPTAIHVAILFMNYQFL